MNIARSLLTAGLVVVTVSCGRAVGSDVDAGGAGSDAAIGADAGSEPDAGTLITTPELVGTWVDMQIGDCIDYETWLHFDDLGGVTYIAGDFNACMDPAEHCRVDRQGSYWIEPGGVVGFEWVGPDRTVVSRRSSSVVDLAEPGAPDPLLHLSLFTYWRPGSAWRWFAHRQSEVVEDPQTPESHIYRVTTDTEIRLDRDPLTLGPEELASLEVTLSYAVEPLDGGSASTGVEAFVFDAALDGALGYPGWPMLTVLQDGQEVNYQWWELLEARGLFDHLPQEAANRVAQAIHGFLLVEAFGAEQIVPVPGYSMGGWFWRAETFDPRPAPACAAPFPYVYYLP